MLNELFPQKMNVGDVCFRNSNHFKRILDSSVADATTMKQKKGWKVTRNLFPQHLLWAKVKGLDRRSVWGNLLLWHPISSVVFASSNRFFSKSKIGGQFDVVENSSMRISTQMLIFSRCFKTKVLKVWENNAFCSEENPGKATGNELEIYLSYDFLDLVEHAEAFTSSRSAHDFGGFGRCCGVVNRSSGFSVLGVRFLHVFFPEICMQFGYRMMDFLWEIWI